MTHEVPGGPLPHQHWLLSVFLILAILVSMWWYLLWSQYLCSPKTHVEILMHNVMLVLGVEVFGGRWLGHDECLYKRGPGDLPTPFYHIRIQVDV